MSVAIESTHCEQERGVQGQFKVHRKCDDETHKLVQGKTCIVNEPPSLVPPMPQLTLKKCELSRIEAILDIFKFYPCGFHNAIVPYFNNIDKHWCCKFVEIS